MWIEGLGICDEGKGAKWLESGGPDKFRVNPSGGMLAGNPLISEDWSVRQRQFCS